MPWTSCPSPPSMSAVIATISASNLVVLGHTSAVQGVALRVERVDLVQKLDVFLVAVIDRARDKAVLPGFLLSRMACMSREFRRGCVPFGSLVNAWNFPCTALPNLPART